MTDFKLQHWGLIDVQYTYLDDGYTIVVTTDVPCHLFKRETTTPPRKHALPSYRRGLYLQGDIRFCFVVYTDFEQDEPGDTLTHTFTQTAWPAGERRWFYFVGKINGSETPSETAIFEFVFPAPPPAPPPPIEKWIASHSSDRTLDLDRGIWAWAHDSPTGDIHNQYGPPLYRLWSGNRLTTLYFIWRSFHRFDTSVLPSTAKIISAEILLYVLLKYAPVAPGLKAIVITEGVQHSPILTSDYGDQLPYTTFLGDRDIDTMVLNAYNDIPLNVGGLALINPAGWTKFCLRGEHDVLDIAPLTSEKQIAYSSYGKGEDYRAYLHVTYYPA